MHVPAHVTHMLAHASKNAFTHALKVCKYQVGAPFPLHACVRTAFVGVDNLMVLLESMRHMPYRVAVRTSSVRCPLQTGCPKTSTSKACSAGVNTKVLRVFACAGARATES